MISSLFKVPGILNFIHRPNLTRWFWLNQWSNWCHISTPGIPKPIFYDLKNQIENPWHVQDFWGDKGKLLSRFKIEKFQNIIEHTTRPIYDWKYFKSHWDHVERIKKSVALLN